MKLPPAKKLLSQLKTKPEQYWLRRGQVQVLKLFHQMAEQVPAYKDFLKRQGIRHQTVKVIDDFTKVPPLSKDNYLRKYPLPQLCWQGKFNSRHWVVATTSGSTGEPFYFPRQEQQDEQYALLAEMYLLDNFQIDKHTTLYINAFPMGAWIGGLFTYEAIHRLAQRGNYKLSLINPGIHKQETIKAVKKIGKYFDQIIIGSYGPFLKDILDDGLRQKINWHKFNMKFIFSAEGFTESFRDYVKKVGGLKNINLDTLNHYGTVDLGTMSHETPLAIMLRRQLVKRRNLYRQVFGETIKLPTLTQYLPELFYFEEEQGQLFCSGASGLPLVRYNLRDHGGVVTLAKMNEIFQISGCPIPPLIRQHGLKKYVWNLPFVYVYERDDFSVSFYAFQVYPETIRRGLQSASLEKKITGKFTMLVKYDRRQNQYLKIHIELKSGVTATPTLKQKVTRHIVQQLLKESSEFRETSAKFPRQTTPRLFFHRYEDEKYFRPGIKQRWTSK